MDAHVGRALQGPKAIAVKAGDSVKLVGVMATVNHNQIFLVRTVEAGGHTYTIRNERGFLVRSFDCHARRVDDARERESAMNRKLLVVVFTAFCMASLAACGGGNGNNNNVVSIAFSQAPPAALQTSAMATIAATVSNSSNTGVDWTVTCGGADCGSLSASHTDGGASLTYTAPASVPTGNTVTITATASADHSASVVGTTTITTGSTTSALNGQYAFISLGAGLQLFNYVAAGSIVADGNGGITSGEEDFCDLPRRAPPCRSAEHIPRAMTVEAASTSTSSSFSSAQTLEFVLTSTNHALITEFDASATSSGTLDLQDPNALDASGITGGFSMALNGVGVQVGEPAALGGVMTADGSGDFNNVTLDVNDPSGSGFTTETTNLLVVSGPDPFGRDRGERRNTHVCILHRECESGACHRG